MNSVRCSNAEGTILCSTTVEGRLKLTAEGRLRNPAFDGLRLVMTHSFKI